MINGNFKVINGKSNPVHSAKATDKIAEHRASKLTKKIKNITNKNLYIYADLMTGKTHNTQYVKQLCQQQRKFCVGAFVPHKLVQKRNVWHKLAGKALKYPNKDFKFDKNGKSKMLDKSKIKNKTPYHFSHAKARRDAHRMKRFNHMSMKDQFFADKSWMKHSREVRKMNREHPYLKHLPWEQYERAVKKIKHGWMIKRKKLAIKRAMNR